MRTRCPLCRQRIPGEHQSWCDCGQAMDPRCRAAHESWCASHGEERWLGAHDL